jgi:hypothetical protein
MSLLSERFNFFVIPKIFFLLAPASRHYSLLSARAAAAYIHISTMNDDDDDEEEGIAHNLAHVSLIAQAQNIKHCMRKNIHTICVCIKAFPERVE